MPLSPIQEYISQVQKLYNEGRATEHSYRPVLKQLIEAMAKGITATNEPKHLTDIGAPDYIITGKDNIPIGYIEAKEIDANLDDIEKSDQLKRYKAGLENLILTDYLEFRWFQKGEKVAHVRIAHIASKAPLGGLGVRGQGVSGQRVSGQGAIKPAPDQYSHFEDLIKEFIGYRGQSITSAETLAKMMAAKARLMHHILDNTLRHDNEIGGLQEPPSDTSLQQQYKAFKDVLMHDITPEEFTDIYAQTIAYGMFAARFNSSYSSGFTRRDALELIPKSNPFLRKLFQYVAGYDLDERLVWVVDALADVFGATDMRSILKNFGKSTQQNDPVIHFYETFLKEYNPALRKSRGVFYTPEPVVDFIVRAVDDILKTEFNLPDGLADTSKVKVKLHPLSKGREGLRGEYKEFHKVQILDPATGTATFLAAVIKQIYKNFEGQEGVWSNYVDDHLIPRLNGFEILMASYAIAHLKLEMLLKETGHTPKKDQRLRVFLTNSLEESHPDTGTLFAQWLSTEANEANYVKRDTPVMVVLGNPPYSISSSNKGKWILNLIADYKKELKETKLNLDDDYIKFIRYGQYFIEKNQEGILAYISNNSFIDGITHRQMRKHLLETFDKIYIINLHGNLRKKETDIYGGKDENVFDIMQGVSINIFIKHNSLIKENFAKLKYSEFLGLRNKKYNFLSKNTLFTIKWRNIENKEPYYFFIPKNFKEIKNYESFASLNSLFKNTGPGCKTERDGLTIKFTSGELEKVIKDFINLNENDLRFKYGLIKDSRDWKVSWAKKDILEHYKKDLIKPYSYRPFDTRFIYYSGISKGFIGTPGTQRFHNMLKDNLGLVFPRICKGNGGFQHGFISKFIIDVAFGDAFSGAGTFFAPLYLYPYETNGQNHLYEPSARVPNLNPEIVSQIAKGLNLRFVPEKISSLLNQAQGNVAPIDILDYIYAVLHSPAYREKYKEFLKIDFPRVPYPASQDRFWQLVKLGGELRQIHLLESPVVNKFITTFPIVGVNGENPVTKIKYEVEPIQLSPNNMGQVWLNDTQYFAQVPLIAWEFYIGGYQPAQKWLKDRKGRNLTYDDITHYQKIIVALTETARIMREVDKVGVE